MTIQLLIVAWKIKYLGLLCLIGLYRNVISGLRRSPSLAAILHEIVFIDQTSQLDAGFIRLTSEVCWWLSKCLRILITH